MLARVRRAATASADLAPDAEVPANGAGRGRCRLWWSRTPGLNDRRIGFVGHLDVDDGEEARAALDAAREVLADAGCDLAVGPVEGSTWANYRLVIDDRGDLPAPLPAFPLEPHNPVDQPAWWRAAGFAELAKYRSTINNRISEPDRLVEYAAAQFDTAGLRLRQLDADDRDAEMRRAHDVCLAAFAGAFLFQPIEADAFVAMMAKAKPLIRPGLVWLAEHDEAGTVGFLFAYPADAETVVTKTVAVLPDRRWHGLGALLLRHVYAEAIKLGYTRAIGATIHDANRMSLKLYRDRMTTFRRYAVFARELR